MRLRIAMPLILILVLSCNQPSAFVCNSYVDLDDDKVADQDEFLGRKDKFRFGESVTAVLRGVRVPEGKESLDLRMRVLTLSGVIEEEQTVTLSEKGSRVFHLPLEMLQPGKYLLVFNGDGKIIGRTEFEISSEGQ